MRFAVIGILAVSGLVGATLATLAAPGTATLPRPVAADAAAAGGLITHCLALDGQRQQLTVVDPQLRVIGVYHIEPSSGEITLKSVRNIHFDLQMTEFNTGNPLPREVRAMHQK